MSVIKNPLEPHDQYLNIKKKGVVDLQQLYADVKKWFYNRGYEFHETDHKAKTPTPIGSEQEIVVKGHKDEEEFYRWRIKMEIYIWDATPVYVMKNGQKTQMYKCRLKIWIEPTIEIDYMNKFESTDFLQRLRDWYISNIARRRFEVQMGDKLEYETFGLHDMIKRDLDMYASGDQFEIKRG